MLISDLPRKTIDFEYVYASANPSQKAAIDSTEGALLVVAGPGSGKTQIIAARITRIIQKGCQPENILCLTYTDAGTIAMRNRILSFIGPDAYRVNIFTFHAFCNLIIQENPLYFGFSDLQTVSELEKRFFVMKALDSLPPEDPLAKEKGLIYSDARGLLELYSVIKREDWNIEEKLSDIDRHIEQLPDQPKMRYSRKYTRDGITYQPGDLKEGVLAAEIKKYERLKSALRSFNLYQAILKENRRYDFEDMILWVIGAFKDNPDLLCDYQERYHYLLVDEYQDTSGSQNEIVDLLMSYWDDPNLFVVGDDDQSIYRFQGANIANILSFQRQYDPLVVTMTENYRSSAQILAAADTLIENNVQRLSNSRTLPGLDINKKLHANRPDGGRPEVRVYPNTIHETLGVATEIELRHLRGEEIGRIAVLYRNHRQVEELTRYLSAKGIPFNTKKREDILHSPLIKQLVTILTYIQKESQAPHSEEGTLFRILHYPGFGIPPVAIARLLASPGAVERSEALKPFRLRLQAEPELSVASGLLETAIANICRMTLQDLIHSVISRFGLLKQSEDTERSIWNLELLNTFFDFVKDECARNPGLNLQQLIEMIEIMTVQKIPLPAERVACSLGGVNLITCHSAKGLEFEIVYLLGCNEDEWEKKRKSPSFASVPGINSGEESDETSVEESRRLFFVAMTRAERKLVISYAEKDTKEKPLARSRFVAELELGGCVDTMSYQLDTGELCSAMQAILDEPPPCKESIYHSDFVGELLKDYHLSATHLSSYLACPHSFFYTNVLRVPKPRNAAMAFGTSVHEALEYLFASMLKSGKQLFPPKAAFIDIFVKEMNKRQDSFTEVEFSRRLANGMQNMEALYDRHVVHWHKDVLIEKPFRITLEGGINLNGRIDKLEKLNGSRVNLVDYKTGSFDKVKFQRPDPAKAEKAAAEGKEVKHEDLHGGDYWRQAVFYKIMVEKIPEFSYQVSSTEFFFVEPDPKSGSFVNHKVEITPDDEKIVMEQIKSAYRRILNREFEQRCSSRYCEWCNSL